jgi:hypothetical protein
MAYELLNRDCIYARFGPGLGGTGSVLVERGTPEAYAGEEAKWGVIIKLTELTAQ